MVAGASYSRYDAFDTLYIGCEKFPQHDVYPVALGGVL